LRGNSPVHPDRLAAGAAHPGGDPEGQAAFTLPAQQRLEEPIEEALLVEAIEPLDVLGGNRGEVTRADVARLAQGRLVNGARLPEDHPWPISQRRDLFLEVGHRVYHGRDSSVSSRVRNSIKAGRAPAEAGSPPGAVMAR